MSRTTLLPIVISACLAGCSIFPSASTYIPVTSEITNPQVYALDLSLCRVVAQGNPSHLDSSSVARQTVVGATNDLAYGVINPLVPAAGAVGGAATATISGFDIVGQNGIKIFLKCLEKETDKDGSAVVTDPGD